MIKAEDLLIESFRAESQGHYLNAYPKGVRITHKPSGKVFESSEQRSPHLNRAVAFKLLRDEFPE